VEAFVSEITRGASPITYWGPPPNDLTCRRERCASYAHKLPILEKIPYPYMCTRLADWQMK
jgi:hypothetical protein